MITLKAIVEMFGDRLSDIRIIKEWFVQNNQEAEGLKLVSELAQSQLNKVERKYDYARTWIPVKVDMCDVCRDKDVARKLDKIINCQILGLEPPDDLLKWARDTIPTMKMPSLFFMDTAKWLDERWGIKFRGDDEPDLCGVCECMYYDTFGDARCKEFGDVEIKDNIRCKECVEYEREVLEERRKMRGL